METTNTHLTSFNNLLYSFDQGCFDQAFKQINKAFKQTFSALPSSLLAKNDEWVAQFYNDFFQPMSESFSSRCFLPPKQNKNSSADIQKTMFAIDQSTFQWSGNTDFKSSFDSYFKYSEENEKKNGNRPKILERINIGKALVNQAAPAYDSLKNIKNNIYSLQNQLRQQPDSKERTDLLQNLENMLKEIQNSPLPSELSKTSVNSYVKNAQTLVAQISKRLKNEFPPLESGKRKDIQSTQKVAHVSLKTAHSHLHDTKVSTVQAKNVSNLQKAMYETVDSCVKDYNDFFNSTNKKVLKYFDDLYKMRLGFLESQKYLIKICFEINQTKQHQIDIQNAAAADKVILEQLKKAESTPSLARNLAQIEDLTNTILTALEQGNIPFERPISFEKLNEHVSHSSKASSLKAHLDALEAFLLADRRSNTLFMEDLKIRQRDFLKKGETTIANQYDKVIERFDFVLSTYPLKTLLGCSESIQEYRNQWNKAYTFAQKTFASQ